MVKSSLHQKYKRPHTSGSLVSLLMLGVPNDSAFVQQEFARVECLPP